MSNVATLFQLEAQAATARGGFSRAMTILRRTAGKKEFFSDGLLTYRATGGAKAELVTNAAVKIYFIDVAAPAGSTTTSYLQVFNTSTASVTLGTTVPELQFPIVSGTSFTIPICDGEANVCPTAGSIAVTTLPGGSVAANTTNAPLVTILYK